MFYIQKCEYDENHTHEIEDVTNLTGQLATINTQLSSIHTHKVTDGEHILRLDQLHDVKIREKHPILYSIYTVTASSQFGTGSTYQPSNAFTLYSEPLFKWSSGTYFYEGELYDQTNSKNGIWGEWIQVIIDTSINLSGYRIIVDHNQELQAPRSWVLMSYDFNYDTYTILDDRRNIEMNWTDWQNFDYDKTFKISEHCVDSQGFCILITKVTGNTFPSLQVASIVYCELYSKTNTMTNNSLLQYNATNDEWSPVISTFFHLMDIAT